MAHEIKAEDRAFMHGMIKAQSALVDFIVDKTGKPVLYEGKRIEGFTTLFHMGDREVLVSGCNVGSQDLRRSINALAMSLVKNYDIPRRIMALTLVQLAKDIIEDADESE